MTDPPHQNTPDGGEVGEHKGDEIEGDDGIEGDVGADVDECQGRRDYT